MKFNIKNVYFNSVFCAVLVILIFSCRSKPADTSVSQFADIKGKPNVLFIAVDDLNDWVGRLGGHPAAVTPNLDRLAQSGITFTQAYCPAPACNPSRAAMLTGIRPSTSGVYHNPQPWRQSPVLSDIATIPQYFRQNGYKAVGSGKIFHDAYPDPVSWDEFWPSLTQQRPPDPKPAKLPANGIPRTDHFDWGPLLVGNEAMSDDKVADWVINQLKKDHDKPLFLAFGLFRPHLPWYVPEKYFQKFPLESIKVPVVPDDDLNDIPEAGINMRRPKDHENVLQFNQWEKAVQSYLASISFMDDCLGRVLNALENSKYKDNTIIVLWSDHGWHLGEKKTWRKFTLWEEAARTVMLMSAPGVTSKNSICEAPVNLLDIYPTLVELSGLPAKKDLEGNSLVPLLKNPNLDWKTPSITTNGRNNHAVRSKQYRYIRYADGGEELYDHEVDSMEWKNLAKDPNYKAIKEDLAKWIPKVNAENSVRDNKGSE